MNRIIRAFAAFIVSICLILAPAISYAASPSGWIVTPADIIIGAAGNTVTAIKGAGASALQSTVKHAPTVGNIGKKLLRGGGAGALLLAVPQIIGDGVSWVLDPANNSVKYFIPDPNSPTTGLVWSSSHTFSVPSVKSTDPVVVANFNCQQFGKGAFLSWYAIGDTNRAVNCTLTDSKGSNRGGSISAVMGAIEPENIEKHIPISTVAAKVQSNAATGHAPSQELIKTVIIDDVNAGVIDTSLNTNAVPVADAPPVNPPYDPTEPVPPFDPSSIIAAIKSVMAAVVNMSGILSAKIDTLMIDLGLKHEEKLAADAVNTAEIVAAIEAIEGNTMDGQLINDAIDRVIANDNVKVGDIVAAIEAIEGNTLDGQVINDAVDRVIANDNVNAQAAADAANTAAEAAKAADAANTAAVTDAIGAQTDAITEADPVTGEMSLKFPKFCSWALPVCTFTDWAMADPQLEEPEDTRPEIQDLTKYDTVDISQNYITASGQCPSAADLNINFGVVKLSYEPLCIILDKLSGVIVAVAYISVGFMIIRTV